MSRSSDFGVILWPHLTIPYETVASWDLRRPSQRRYRSGFAPDSLFSSDRNQRHLFVFSGFRPKLFKEPNIIFGDSLTVLAASHSVTRLSEKSLNDECAIFSGDEPVRHSPKSYRNCFALSRRHRIPLRPCCDLKLR